MSPTRLCVLVLALCSVVGVAVAAGPQHAIAMYGKPKYGPDFTHFDYVNPDAPKGGTLRLANVSASTFDSLNPFILKGNPADGLSYVYDTLMVQSLDEPFTEYGLIAKTVEVAPDRTWVRFTLRKSARFHDGTPVTADDVVFSFRTLKKEGHPHYRLYYRDVTSVEKNGPHEVTFHFRSGHNRELPLIIGQLPVLPKHWWKDRDFSSTSLEPPMGSGPYRVAKVEQGKRIVYQRVKDYWARDLPVNKGRYNADRITYDYYRDGTVALQALKAGEYDLRQENVAKNWATAYNIPAVKKGQLIKAEIHHSMPTGMQGFFYNTRREVFQDPRVREALAYAFDFQWTNKNLFYGAYKRTESYFSNSELASSGLPSDAELALLKPYRDQLPKRVFTQGYKAPTTAGDHSLRGNLRKALELLQKAGWHVNNGTMVNDKTGKPMRFEILLNSPSFERVTLPFVDNLKRLGIQASVRTVDPTQYQNRLNNFDFDMTVYVVGESLSPGNEQRQYWSCEAAKTQGSQNIAGICDPVVDDLIDKVINAPDRDSLITRVHALDRVLLWNFYVIPHWHLDYFRVAYWNKFGRPKENPPYGLATDSWWIDPDKAAKLADRLNH
ncbi:MAG TPA: extracellular solute-binding protein [Gammaproteobacteria bacterium]|nr:extracellular solute-binding protein [Gammaproteobacteria bacterium]